MSKKRAILFTAMLVLTLTLPGCVMQASTPPGPTATPAQLDEIFNQMRTATARAFVDGVGGGDLDTPTPDGAETQDPTAEQEGLPAVVTATPEPQATKPPVQVSPINVPEKYTLRKGEHPYCIARRFDIDVNALLTFNGLGLGGTYPEGLVLKIPQNAPKFAAERALLKHPTDYTVAAGDTLYVIACKFGNVSPEQIAEANGKDMDWKPAAGEKISIP